VAAAEPCAIGVPALPVVAAVVAADVVVAAPELLLVLVELEPAVVGVLSLPPPQAASRAAIAVDPAPADTSHTNPRRLIA